MPLPPTINTWPVSGATNPIWWRISHAAGDSPTMPSPSGSPKGCSVCFAQRAGIQPGRLMKTKKQLGPDLQSASDAQRPRGDLVAVDSNQRLPKICNVDPLIVAHLQQQLCPGQSR